MTSARKITDTAFGGGDNNEGQRLQFSERSILNRFCSSPSCSIIRRRQYPTACDWFAKVQSLTRDIIQSKTSGSTVTLMRIFRSSMGFLGILSDKCESYAINICDNYCSFVASYATGLSNHDREQPISERYVRQLIRRHPEASRDRGDANGPEDRDGAFTEPPGEDQACDHGHDGVLHGLRGGGGQLRQVPPLTEACP